MKPLLSVRVEPWSFSATTELSDARHETFVTEHERIASVGASMVRVIWRLTVCGVSAPGEATTVRALSTSPPTSRVHSALAVLFGRSSSPRPRSPATPVIVVFAVRK